VFTVKIPQQSRDERIMRAIVIENLQDPGNVGTIIRSANAFDIDAVIMVGACADLYNPKTVRASMGAIFRQRVLRMSIDELDEFTRRQCLPLFGAALSDKAADIRNAELHRSAVAIGSEGRGLSRELLDICGGELIIPMNPHSESLNAAIAASVIMWEMSR
jgi:TrmH family RNA methyltransferase